LTEILDCDGLEVWKNLVACTFNSLMRKGKENSGAEGES
jgi:hypothetical protein